MDSPIVAPPSDELPPDSAIGPYRVVRPLGKGGMGVVYEAVQPAISRRVAIKILRPELANDRERAARFVNEARAVNLVDHPGVVQVADMGQQADGTPYIVMEFLRGETLASLLKRSGGTLPWIDVVRYAQQIMDVLLAAHSKNIVHRDLKPENVMLVDDAQLPGGKRIKVLDFGIAKLIDEVNESHFRTKTGALLGSPAYMSPEQCKGGERITVQSDLYALGIVMYELLAGQLPHVADGPGHMVVLHMFGEPRPLRHLRPGLPEDLYRLIDALLQKQPAARPVGSEVAQRLQQLTQGGSGLSETLKTWGLGLTLGLLLSAGIGTGVAKARLGRWWWQPAPATSAGTSTAPSGQANPPILAPSQPPAEPSAQDRVAPAHSTPTRPTRSSSSTPARVPSSGGTESFAPVDVSKARSTPTLPIKPVR